MERPPFSLPQAKSMIFICTQSHETIMFMEYQMQVYTVVLSRGSVITRGMHRFSATIYSFRGGGSLSDSLLVLQLNRRYTA